MIKSWLNLLRVRQYYKNLLIFVPLFFGKVSIDAYVLGFVGFIMLCMYSSSGYILNDLIDYKRDKIHKEKKERPLASGVISRRLALLVMLSIVIISSAISYSLGWFFFLCGFGLFVNMTLYSLFFKNIAIADLHFISFNYVLRAASGVFLGTSVLSPWLIFLIFIVALFLGTGKRKADLILLGEKSKQHKRVYHVYTEKFLDWLAIVLLGVLFMSYILYSFMAHGSKFMITIPFFSFIILRYLYLVTEGDVVARKTEYFFKDKQLLIPFIGWVLTSLIALYFI